MDQKNYADLVDMLQQQAAARPNDIAFTFLVNGDDEEENITFGELDLRARAIGAYLQATGKPLDRAVLLYGPGLDYIVAFFGCLYGGATAVTAYPPDPARLGRTLPRLESIINDCDARVVLTTSTIMGMSSFIFELAPSLKSREWVATNELPAATDWKAPKLGADALAFIQYTSGSTGTPKGVMLTHGNLLANERSLHRWLEASPADVAVGWLPLFHDMGLMGHVILPVYAGFRSVFMSPMDFLGRPARWVKAISKYRGTVNAAPNFAYDLCARKTTDAERALLDLSSWRVSINGAEPVRADTIERFVRAFEPHGLKPSVVHPAYGLAEATLIVSCNLPAPMLPLYASFDAASLEQGIVQPVDAPSSAARTLVGCGHPLEQSVVITEPDTGVVCPPDRVGEIWISGDNVGQGYWARTEETEHTFQAKVESAKGERFLRTGDLGFFHDGQLFIAGRIKDLIIVRGRNHYPQDVERTAEDSHASVRRGCTAAFSVTVSAEERLVIVAEVDEGKAPFEPDAIIGKIRAAVSEVHELPVEAVVLIKARSIGKTSSGKIQRRACRAAYLGGSLEELARSALVEASTSSNVAFDAAAFQAADPETRLVTARAYLLSLVASSAGLPAESVKLDQLINRLGIDSLGVIELRDQVEAETGMMIDAVDLLRDTSIEDLAQRMCNPSEEKGILIPPLLPRSPSAPVPLSFPQRFFWEFEKNHPKTATWNLPIAVRIAGPLDHAVLKLAINEVVSRHDGLRAGFELDGDTPVQVFHAPAEVSLSVVDLQSLDATARGEAIERAITEEQALLFDLFEKKGPTPLLRAQLLQAGTNEHVLLCTAHHLVIDGGSIALFLEEVVTLYASFSRGAPCPLGEVPIEYGDFAAWQRSWITDETLKPLADYWSNQLGGATPFLWPADAGLPVTAPIAAYEFPNFIPPPLVGALQALASREGATLAMVIMTALKACLRRWTGKDDVIVVLPASTRRQSASLADVIGNFTDTVVIRSDFSGGLTFRQALAKERDVTIAAYANADYPAELVLGCDSAFDSPLNPPVMNMQPAWPGRRLMVNKQELTFEPMPAKRPVLPFHAGLLFLVIQIPHGLLTFTHFHSRGMKEADARRLADELHAGVAKWAEDPDAPI